MSTFTENTSSFKRSVEKGAEHLAVIRTVFKSHIWSFFSINFDRAVRNFFFLMNDNDLFVFFF